MLGLRWFRGRTCPDALARDHGISRATVHRYLDEVIAVLADQAPRPRNALQRSLRCLGERGFALLTGRWRTLRHITVPVLIDRIDVTLNEAAEILHGRSYVAGRWECPHHCNPRTGQRMHYGQEFR